MSKSSTSSFAGTASHYDMAHISGGTLLTQDAQKRHVEFEDITWNSKNPASSAQLYGCFRTQKNVKLKVDESNWRTEFPELCKVLGLRYAATESEVLHALESSDAFQPSSTSPNLTPSEFQAGKTVQYKLDNIKGGKMKLRISIPVTFRKEFAFKDSQERIELELFTKRELARAFKIPNHLLATEISVVDVKPGSVVIYVTLSVAALLLVLIGLGIMQTPEWQMHRFKILMGLGGLVLGGVAGLFGGPLGSFVGGVMGWSLGLGTAWLLVNPAGNVSEPRATAAITYPDNTASVTLTFNKEPCDNLQTTSQKGEGVRSEARSVSRKL